MNPFKKNNQIIPTASINSVYIDDKLASDLFRPTKIAGTIKEHSEQLEIQKTLSDKDIFKQFNDKLTSKNKVINRKANEIATMYGERLANIICTLKKPSKLSIENRNDWTHEHWDYWKKINNITFVGGLTSPVLTRKFLKIINNKLIEKEINDLNVSFIEGSSNLGTLGLSTQVTEGEHLLFDFGQTFIKRAHHMKKNSQTVLNANLESIPSDYLFYKYKDESELKRIALSLHKFIIQTIKNTIEEVQFEGNNILISIANYVQNGAIYKARGGYGKLALLSGNYQKFLQEELSKDMSKNVTISLYHDTTAMSLALQNERKGAIISLGTAFGVAFIE